MEDKDQFDPRMGSRYLSDTTIKTDIEGRDATFVPAAKEQIDDYTDVGFTTPVVVDNGVGGVEYQERLAEINKALYDERWDPMLGAVKRQFWHGGNYAVNFGKFIYNKLASGPADPSWNQDAVTQWIEQRAKYIPDDQRWRYYGTINQTEADMRFSDYQSDQTAAQIMARSSGVGNFVAGAIAGLVDIDTPLAFISGGLSVEAKLGWNATRMGRMVMGSMQGGAVGAGLAAFDYDVNPSADAANIAMGFIAGSGLGLAGGALRKGAQVDVTHDMRKNLAEEIGQNVQRGTLWTDFGPQKAEPPAFVSRRQEEAQQAAAAAEEAAQAAPKPEGAEPASAPRKPVVFDPADLVGAEGSETLLGGGSTVGAKQLNPGFDGQGYAGIGSTEQKKRLADYDDWKKQSPEVREYEDPASAGNYSSPEAEANAARAFRLRDAIQKIPGIMSDFDRLMKSNLSSAQWLAVNVLESPSTIGQGKVSAAGRKEAYHQEIVGEFQPYYAAYDMYKAQTNYNWKNIWNESMFTGPTWTHKEKFNQEVLTELMARKYNDVLTTNPAIKQAADAVDAAFKKEWEIGRGKDGELSLGGYDAFEWYSGYMQQKWSGRKMGEAFDAAERSKKGGGKKYRDGLVKFISGHYANQAPSWNPKQRDTVAAAVVDRALSSRKGLQRDLIALLRGDEKDFIIDALKRNGFNQDDADKVIEGIVGSRQQKTQLGHTMHRQDVDFRATDGGYRMMDLLETDLEQIVGDRARKTSGMAALARIGIVDRVSWEAVKKDILDQQSVRGNRILRGTRTTADKIDDMLDAEQEISPEFLDAVYGYFSGIRPVGMGAQFEQTASRIMKLTRMVTMNQMGITAAIDHGSIAGTVGWKLWWDHLADDVKNAMAKTDSELLKEFKQFHLFVPEDAMFNDRALFELHHNEATGILSKLDAVLDEGLRLQSRFSGFFAVQNQLKRVALSATTAKLYQGVKSGAGGFSTERLKSMGIDPDLVNRTIQHATFDADGNLIKLNMSSWDPMDVQEFQFGMTRALNQIVQQGMSGETNYLWHSNGFMRLLGQFKSYPLLSIDKQFTRNMRHMDEQTVQTFVFGMAMAGSIYTMREVINGKGIPDAKEIAYGAMNYSNMAGWLPMLIDPALAAVGADYRLSGYEPRGSANVFAVPPAWNVMNNIVKAPGAVARLLLPGQDTSNGDIRAMQTITPFGNIYGLNALYNLAREDNSRKAKPKDSESIADTWTRWELERWSAPKDPKTFIDLIK